MSTFDLSDLPRDPDQAIDSVVKLLIEAPGLSATQFKNKSSLSIVAQPADL